MKILLLEQFSSKNYIKIAICVLFSAVSQPLIAWSFSGLAGSFFMDQSVPQIIVRNACFIVLALVISWISNSLKADLSYDAELSLRSKVFSSIYSKSIGDFEKSDSGTYYNQIGRNIQMLKSSLYEASLNILTASLSIVFIVVMLLYCHWMSLVVVLLFLVPLILNNYFMPKRIEKHNDNVMGLLTNMVVKLKDVLGGFFNAKFQEGNEYIEKSMFKRFSQATYEEKKIEKLNNLRVVNKYLCKWNNHPKKC